MIDWKRLGLVVLFSVAAVACGDNELPDDGSGGGSGDGGDNPNTTEFVEVFSSTTFDSASEAPKAYALDGQAYVVDGIFGFDTYRFEDENLRRTYVDGSTSDNPWLATAFASTADRIIVKGIANESIPTIRIYGRNSASTPTFLGQAPIDSATGPVGAVANFVLTASVERNGIQIWDAQDSNDLVATDFYETTAQVRDFVIADNALYALVGRDILMYSIQESGAALQFEGDYPLLAESARIKVDSGYLLVTEQAYPKALSVAEAFNPVVTYEGPEMSQNNPPLAVGAGYLFVGTATNVLALRQDGGTFVPETEIEALGPVTELVVVDNLLYVFSADKGLQIIRAPAAP